MYKIEDGTPALYYTHTDHLGSIIAVTDDDNNILEHYSYDAWGRRRTPTDYSYSGFTTSYTNRGYTGHEHLDAVSLINMNGRTYDPRLGRMLQPDNYVQIPDYSQSLNRYSYCFNNPLVYIDPDGENPLIAIGIFIAASGIMCGTLMATDPYLSGWDWDKFWQGAAWGASMSAVNCASALIPGLKPWMTVPALVTLNNLSQNLDAMLGEDDWQVHAFFIGYDFGDGKVYTFGSGYMREMDFIVETASLLAAFKSGNVKLPYPEIKRCGVGANYCKKLKIRIDWLKIYHWNQAVPREAYGGIYQMWEKANYMRSAFEEGFN